MPNEKAGVAVAVGAAAVVFVVAAGVAEKPNVDGVVVGNVELVTVVEGVENAKDGAAGVAPREKPVEL